MRVLVVARTRMSGDRVCVGGIDLPSGRSLRLLGSDGWNLPEDKPIRPGEIWELHYQPRPASELVPPHVEDVIVSRGHLVGQAGDLRAAILEVWEPWRGELDGIFEGRLDATPGGRAFLDSGRELPPQSTGFWIAGSDLVLAESEYGRSYRVRDGTRIRWVKYTGMDDPTSVIPSGSLIRFSLARWHSFDGEPPRCWLQLSGWYG